MIPIANLPQVKGVIGMLGPAPRQSHRGNLKLRTQLIDSSFHLHLVTGVLSGVLTATSVSFGRRLAMASCRCECSDGSDGGDLLFFLILLWILLRGCG
jgi:hypothetical protein